MLFRSDEEPFPDTTNETDHTGDSGSVAGESDTDSSKHRPASGQSDKRPDHQSPDSDGSEECGDELFPDPPRPPNDSGRRVIVTKADKKVIIHWDAATGIVHYQNGVPVDHPQLLAFLCDAKLEVIHYTNGTPNGIVTTQRTANPRQDQYLAKRDGKCREPGCPGIGRTEAHHMTHWTKHHQTATSRMYNACYYSHQREHDGDYTVTGDPEATLTYTYKDGRITTSTAWKN